MIQLTGGLSKSRPHKVEIEPNIEIVLLVGCGYLSFKVEELSNSFPGLRLQGR